MVRRRPRLTEEERRLLELRNEMNRSRPEFIRQSWLGGAIQQALKRCWYITLMTWIRSIPKGRLSG